MRYTTLLVVRNEMFKRLIDKLCKERPNGGRVERIDQESLIDVDRVKEKRERYREQERRREEAIDQAENVVDLTKNPGRHGLNY